MSRPRHVLPAATLALAALLWAPMPGDHRREPAGAQEATPGGQTGTPEVLVEATLPADFLPPNPVWVDVYRMEWDPGATWPYAETYRSLRVWCVEAGRFTIGAEGPVAVTRTAPEPSPASPEAVSPGSEAMLGPGDCAVTPPEGTFTLRNPGAEAAVVANGIVVPANVDVPGGYPFGLVREEEPFGSAMFAYELPAGPVAVRLERLPLLAGTGRQEAADLFAAPPEGAARVVRIARRPDPPIAYAITVSAAPSADRTQTAPTPAAGAAAQTLLSVAPPVGGLPPDATRIRLT